MSGSSYKGIITFDNCCQQKEIYFILLCMLSRKTAVKTAVNGDKKNSFTDKQYV
jgi:hypothetical protein